MNKVVISFFLAGALLATAAQAQYRNAPDIPAKTFDVRTLGATGDSRSQDTAPIQNALNMAAKDGGKVLIPKGVYLCGPLTIGNKTELILEDGAVLRLDDDIDHFPVVKDHYRNFLEFIGTGDLKISGKGIIDGQGKVWWERYDAKKLTYRRPQLLFAEKCSRLEITGVTFLDPPNTHMSLKDVDDVNIHHMTISAPANSHNTDGINISAKNCTIENCDISTGDDNIAFNFGARRTDGPECEHLLIRNCRFGYGHGLSIGSYTSGGLRDLKVEDCIFTGTTSGIRIKSARGRGGIVEDLTYQNIMMQDVRYPVAITSYYPKEPVLPEQDTVVLPSERTPVYRNIVIKGLTVVNAAYGIRIWGLPGIPVGAVHFEDVKLSSKKGSFIYNAERIDFTRCNIINKNSEPLLTYRADITGF